MDVWGEAKQHGQKHPCPIPYEPLGERKGLDRDTALETLNKSSRLDSNCQGTAFFRRRNGLPAALLNE
jgi:hypothetical protein